MPILVQHFYDLNDGRRYPLDDAASGVSDSGDKLPNDLLTDLRLTFPSSAGQYAFLASIAVTDHTVTVTFQAADDPEASATFQPLAVLSVPQPITPGRVYSLQPHLDGVGGFVAFGEGAVSKRLSLRFASPAQSRLSPRTARAYEPLPVQSVGKLHNSEPLQGIVRLSGQGPIEIVAEELEIDEVTRTAAVFRLREQANSKASLLEDFAGPCGKRPESHNCGDPEPIERVFGVQADCEHNITLELSGCAELSLISGGHGVVISCGVGLGDVCQDRLPDELGTYTLYESDCVYDWETGESDSDGDSDSDSDPDPGESESSALVFPYLECFSDMAANSFEVVSGEFVFSDDDSPEDLCNEGLSESDMLLWSYASEGELSPGSRNLAVLERPVSTSLGLTAIADLKVLSGPSAHNGGVLFNYLPHPTLSGRHTWFLASVDFDTLEFRLSRFNGSVLVNLASVSVPGLRLDEWYRVTVLIEESMSADAAISIDLEGVDSPEITADVGPVLTNQYFPSDGLFGFHANRSRTRFSFLSIDET